MSIVGMQTYRCALASIRVCCSTVGRVCCARMHGPTNASASASVTKIRANQETNNILGRKQHVDDGGTVLDV